MIRTASYLIYSQPRSISDPLRHAHLSDFLQAIKDTQRALSTGELVDRETRHVIKKAVGGWRLLNNKACRDNLRIVDGNLDEVRLNLLQDVKDGSLKQQGEYFVIFDPALGRELEKGRVECLRGVNKALVKAGLLQI